MKKVKQCSITGIVGYEEDFYKDGKYPYASFVELFRAKYKIPVKELRSFVSEINEKQRPLI